MINKEKQHDNSHEHGCGCSCGSHDHDHEEKCRAKKNQGPITLNKEEVEMLLFFKENKYIPISEFVMAGSENDHIAFSALAPVYLMKSDDTMEDVKKVGTVLKSLEEKDIISLDYHIPLQGYDYSIHTDSKLFKYLIKTIEDGKDNPDFLCDKAEIELGSAALTPLGENAAKSITVEE
ncbi:MAG: hypothetical protein RSD88_06570 [Anaerovoracaceae bacterium]